LNDTTITCKVVVSGELGDTTSEWVTLEGELLDTYNERFGDPEKMKKCVDNINVCGNLTYTQQYQLEDLGCGALVAKRRFRANDWDPTPSAWSATQTITVQYVPEWTLTFPRDLEFSCNDGQAIPEPDAPKTVIGNGSCAPWALNVTADTFEIGDGVCMKIVRHYTVTNWCNYDGESEAFPVTHNGEDGVRIDHTSAVYAGRHKLVYSQVIKITSNDLPRIEIDDVEECIVGVGDASPFNREDVTPVSYTHPPSPRDRTRSRMPSSA